MINKILMYIISFLLVLLVGLGIWGYSIYKDLQETKITLRVIEGINTQNQKYYEEMIIQKEDSLQLLSGLIINLNKEKDVLNKKWITQVTSLQLQIQNLLVKDTASSSDGEDEIGEFKKVDFSGKESIVRYEGYTKHYFKLNKSKYQLSFLFDPIFVKSELLRDENKIWKIQTHSLTPGVLLMADYSIDSLFYSMVEGDKLPVEEEITPFGIRVKASILGSWEKEEWRNQHTFELSAEFYYKYLHLTYYYFQKSVGVGVYYDFNINKFIKSIF